MDRYYFTLWLNVNKQKGTKKSTQTEQNSHLILHLTLNHLTQPNLKIPNLPFPNIYSSYTIIPYLVLRRETMRVINVSAVGRKRESEEGWRGEPLPPPPGEAEHRWVGGGKPSCQPASQPTSQALIPPIPFWLTADDDLQCWFHISLFHDNINPLRNLSVICLLRCFTGVLN